MAREYARAYRLAVKEGRVVPIPAAERIRRNSISCDQCGRSFYRPPANRLGRGAMQYCSRTCMSIAFVGHESPRKLEPVTKPCSQCRTPVARPPWWDKVNKHVFCNRKCFSAWKAVHWRGKNNPAWRGGAEYYYGPNWTRQARRTRKRDSHRCQFCNAESPLGYRNLDVHHIRPFRYFKLENYKRANLLTNLVTLCGPCHCFLEKLCVKGDVTDWQTLFQLGMARLSKSKFRQVALSDAEAL